VAIKHTELLRLFLNSLVPVATDILLRSLSNKKKRIWILQNGHAQAAIYHHNAYNVKASDNDWFIYSSRMYQLEEWRGCVFSKYFTLDSHSHWSPHSFIDSISLLSCAHLYVCRYPHATEWSRGRYGKMHLKLQQTRTAISNRKQFSMWQWSMRLIYCCKTRHTRHRVRNYPFLRFLSYLFGFVPIYMWQNNISHTNRHLYPHGNFSSSSAEPKTRMN
jgi:hypothetical protein